MLNFYQAPGADTAPVKVFWPVYAPAREIEPGTLIPQYVLPVVGVDVLVGFGIWIKSVPGELVGANATPAA